MGLKTPIGFGTPMEWHGKLCGVYVGEKRTYYREAVVEKHFCRKFHGWGIQKEVLQALRARGCVWVCIALVEQRKALIAPLAEFFEKGITEVLSPQDGEQVFLHQSRFEERDMVQRKLQQVASISMSTASSSG